MLVDDEPDILTIFKQGLERRGYSVDAFGDPERALERVRPSEYGHILLDIKMPKINGFDLARLLWQKDKDAKICFLSSFEIYEDEAKKVFKDLNSFCFIKKPTTVKALVEHIESH